MRKRFIALSFVCIILALIFILPPFMQRLESEKNHRIFTVALDTADVASRFENEDLNSIFKGYRDSGVSAAVIREESGTFHSDDISLAKDAGFDIALMLFAGSEKSADFPEAFKKIVEENNVKYILLKNSGSKENDAFTDDICSIISERGITLILCENLSQLSNEKPAGYETYIESAGGRLMRCYETLTKSYASDRQYDAIYYQMLNSAVDRNTEFILVNQLADGGSEFDNATRTQSSIKKFCHRMTASGYIEGGNADLSSYNTNLRTTSAAVAAISVIMLFVIYMLLSGKVFHPALYSLAAAAFLITLFMPDKLLLLYPTAFSALAPSFCFTLCYHLSHKEQKMKTTVVFATAFISLCFCAMCMCALLSGIDFYMNNLIFRGVMLTLIVPVVFAALVYFFKNKPDIKNIKAKHIIICLIFAAVGALYLIRSGNTSISEFERMIRDRIVDITVARPRTKEFLIGWPCLMLFVLTSKKQSLANGIFALGSSVLFASVINSFCHVFCDGAIIYQRTLNGLLFSLPVVIILYFLIKNGVFKK